MKKIFSLFAAVLMAGSMMAETVSKTSFSAVSGDLDENVSYASYQGGAGTAPAISGSAIRLYQRASPTSDNTYGGYLVITAKNGYSLDQVKFTNGIAGIYATSFDQVVSLGTDMGTGVTVTNGQESTVACNGATYAVIYVLGTSSSSRIYVKSLDVVYSKAGGEASLSANDVTLESGATSGEISYSISNPVAEQALTASCVADWISNVAVDAANSKVTFATTANTGAAREATVVLTYGSITKNVTVSQKRYVQDFANLPLTVAAGQTSAQVKDLDGVNLVCDGSDYNNATHKVKFSKNTHYLQVKTNARPGVCTFSVKACASAGVSTFILQGSADGTNWFNVDTFEVNFAKKDTVVEVSNHNDFQETDRYVKLVFLKRTDEVNCGLGAFSIAEYVAPVTPVVLTGAVTAEAINITTESTGTWYGNILSEYYYGQYKGSMTDSVIVQALADQNLESADELYTGSKSFTIADLTFNDAALTPGKYYFIAGGLVVDEDPSSMYGYANNGEPIVVEFTVADPVLSFTFAPGENGVVTVTPNMNDKHYVVIFSNEDLLETMSAFEPCTEESLIANYVASLNYLDEPESVVLSGVNDVDINEFAASQYEVLYVALSSGTYSMIVVEVENNGRYWTLAEGSGRYEGVSYTFALPDFVGTVVLGETGISVTGIEEDEDLYVCYMLDKATYDEFSAAYSDDDLMNMTLGSSLPDETFALYHTLGDVVLYADQDYFVDPELGGAGEYVVLVANVDMMTGKIGSHAVSYPVTLDAEGKKSTTTAIDNVEAAKVAKTIENGQVVIIREGVRYNAVGAKL